MEAFNNEGFDGDLVESEQKRQKENEADAEAKQKADREAAAEKKRIEDKAAAEEREKEQDLRRKREQEDSERTASPNRRVVFVGGLAGASVAHLTDLFNEYGTIVECHIPKLKADIGFVEYSSSSEAAKAVRLGSAKTLLGNPIRVNLAKPKGGEGTSGSGAFPGQGMTQAERIATYGVGTGYINYVRDHKQQHKEDGFMKGDQRIPFDRSMLPQR